MSEQRKAILVVDDEETILFMTRTHLKAAGYEVLTASSGKEALKQLETTDPDLILLDIMMPDMNGFALCREIRRRPATTKTPVLMVSALKSETDTQAAKECGADGYLVKPAKREDLLKTIRKFVGSPFR